MRARVWPLAAGVLIAAAALVAVSSLGPSTPPTRAAQAATLAGELRCPDCQGLSVAESRTAAAQAIRAEIVAQLSAGRSADEARQSFVDRYGDWILLRPTAPLVWLVPLLALAGALVLVTTWMLRRRARPVSAPATVDAVTRGRLDEETEALDA